MILRDHFIYVIFCGLSRINLSLRRLLFVLLLKSLVWLTIPQCTIFSRLLLEIKRAFLWAHGWITLMSLSS